MRTEYVDKLVSLMKEAAFDAVLICPGEELRFFAGFTPTQCERFQGLFITAAGSAFYVCNLLYGDQVRAGLKDEVPVYTWFDNEEMTDVVGAVLKEQGLTHRTIGVNSTAQAFNVLSIAETAPVTFRNAKPLLEEVRIRKTPQEQEYLRKSADIADAVFNDALSFIRPGMTEGDVLDFLMKDMIRRGADSPEGIVASGPNSSYPHYHGRERVIAEKDVIVLDFGCAYHEMMSDLSRTVFVGGMSAEEAKLYDLVERANAASEAAAALGAYIPEIDQAARDVLATEGYEKTLLNRVGHGIGYSVHEGPYITQINRRHLEKGMAFSIEPGVYLPGRIGIRIEDIVLINEEGETEILNHSAREPKIICPL